MSGIAHRDTDFLGVLVPGGDIPYLVVSDGTRPRWALPTSLRDALRASLAIYTPGTITGMAAWQAARLAIGSGLGSLLPGSRRVLRAPLSHALAEIVGIDEIHLAVASSMDGRRCVIGMIDALGRMRGFAKVASGADAISRARLLAEADGLERLGGSVRTMEVPRVLHLGPLEDFEALVVSPIRGRPGLHPSRLSRRRVDAAAQIFTIRGPTTTIRDQLDFGADDVPWDRRIDAVRAATRPVADLPLPSGLVHGDFAAWNLLEEDGRVAGIVDWEQARFVGPPFWDLWHFCVMAAGPGRSRGALAAMRRAVRGRGRLAGALRRYATACDVPVRIAPDMLLVYLARTGAEGIDHMRAGIEGAHRGIAFRARLLDEMLEVLG